ncbi:MAG TPA: hypothetical protein VKA80_03080, partial [Beijerinckiaceae bacterium]|nr:hypothetical protein [Beijerinckiaceae bacterium]
MSNRVAIRAFLTSGGRVLREGDRIALQGEAPPALAQALCATILPVPDPAATLGVRELLRARAGRLYAIRSEAEAREAVAVLAAAPVLGFDVETEVNPEWRGPVEVRFTKAGDPAKRQPRGTAFALDPLRSKPRLVQLFARPADGCFVFDMRAVPWSVLAPVLTSSKLIAVNAIFDLKRVLQAGIVPRAAGDPLRLAALTHGLVRGVSLASLAKLVLRFDVPKEFARSDWGADTLSRAQWEYAALDAVLALDLYRELMIRLSDDERQVACLVEANLVPAARMELAGVPFDAAAHARMVSGWK